MAVQGEPRPVVEAPRPPLQHWRICDNHGMHHNIMVRQLVRDGDWVEGYRGGDIIHRFYRPSSCSRWEEGLSNGDES